MKEMASVGRPTAARSVLDDEAEEADRVDELPRDPSRAKLARLSALMAVYNSKLVRPSLRQGPQDRHAEGHVAPTRAVIDTAHSTKVFSFTK